MVTFVVYVLNFGVPTLTVGCDEAFRMAEVIGVGSRPSMAPDSRLSYIW